MELAGLAEENLVGREIGVVGSDEVVLDIDAIHSDAGERDALAIDYRVGLADECHAWLQLDQGLWLATVDRQIVELRLINLISNRRTSGLDLLGGSRFDCHCLGDRADLKHDGRNGKLRGCVELQVCNGGDFESLLANFDSIE